MTCASFTIPEPPSGDTINEGDIFHFAKLPSNATVYSIWIYGDEVGDEAPLDVGLYKASGAVADVNCFAVGGDDDGEVDMGEDHELYKYEIFGMNKAKMHLMGKPLWEWAGETSDPQTHYYISGTFGDIDDGEDEEIRIGAKIMYVID